MLSENIVLHGSDEPLSRQTPLSAGPLTLVFEPATGLVRYLRLGDREVLRGVYAAVRDQFWNTIDPRVHNLKVAAANDGFEIDFDVECRQPPIDFFWHGRIVGDAQGTVVYSFDGQARSTFLRNRIGFCILHPGAGCSGQPCTVTEVGGQPRAGKFPDEISPHQPFFNMQAIAHEVQQGVTAEVRFDGDIFEMEDQRNWTDDSLKTYCTPLALPRPVEIKAGTRVRQTVTLQLRTPQPLPAATARPALAKPIEIGRGPAIERLPRIGLGLTSVEQPLTEKELAWLKAAKPAHLRVDLRPSDMRFPQQLEQAALDARALGCPLEIAILEEPTETRLAALVGELKMSKPAVARWLLFQPDHSAVGPEAMDLARNHLRRYDAHAQLVTGTDVYFTELNRQRPKIAASDGVCYTINPQVHAFDDASLMETLTAQADTARSARRLYPDQWLAVTPITLRPRFNPNGSAATADDLRLPTNVDVRQMSLFAAAWTLGSIRSLTDAGADSLTYFETAGWRGILAPQSTRPHAKFPSLPGTVFPVYHLLADLAKLAGSKVHLCRSSRGDRVAGVHFASPQRQVTLLANLTPVPQSVELAADVLTGADRRVRLLDASTALLAMRSPNEYRANPGDALTQSTVRLGPYAIARIESKATT